jgi:hypothetical protein
MRSQLTGTGQSGESATDDNDVLHGLRFLLEGSGEGWTI